MLLFIIYYLTSPIIFILLLIISPFNKKIKKALLQQQKSIQKIKPNLETHKKKIIIHAASAGEYEQIKPLLKIIDRNAYFIILTCMSPTIYQSIKADELSDVFCYHLFDFPWNAKKFFKTTSPLIYLTTRHDIWPTHLYIAKKMNIKTIIINANLYQNSKRLKWYSKNFTKYIFNLFDLITVPSKSIKTIFNNKLQINDTHIIPDTRFEQVTHRKKESNGIPELELIGKNNIIFGSIGWKDLEIISSILEKSIDFHNLISSLIIVPHEVEPKLIKKIESICKKSKLFNNVIKLSNFKKKSNYQTIIIDKVGILPELYKYSKIAYIGGGFENGAHSTIEPLIYNNIVCYGPNIDILDEAKEMSEKGCGFIVNNAKEMNDLIKKSLNNSNFQMSYLKNIKHYMDKKEGSSEKIYQIIEKYA